MAKVEKLGQDIFLALDRHSCWWDHELDNKELSPRAQKRLERDGKSGLTSADLGIVFDGIDRPAEPVSAQEKAFERIVTLTEETNSAWVTAELEEPLGPFGFFWLIVPVFGWIWYAIKYDNTEAEYEAAKRDAEKKTAELRAAVEAYAG